MSVDDDDHVQGNDLLFTLEGDGVNEKEPLQGTFVIHPSSGELLQIKVIFFQYNSIFFKEPINIMNK